MNINYITKEPYTNGNNEALEKSKQEKGFKNDYWMTYLQAKEQGLRIKRDSKGTLIQIPIFDKEDKEKTDPLYFKKVYLFNIEQTEIPGLSPENTKKRDFSAALNAFGGKKEAPEPTETPVAVEKPKPILLNELKFELK